MEDVIEVEDEEDEAPEAEFEDFSEFRLFFLSFPASLSEKEQLPSKLFFVLTFGK